MWIEEDTDELAHRVTRRPQALPATAYELDEAARRAAALDLDGALRPAGSDGARGPTAPRVRPRAPADRPGVGR